MNKTNVKGKWQNAVAEIHTHQKDPNVKYIKVLKDFSVPEKVNMTIIPYLENLEILREKGFMNDEEFEKKSAMDWISHVISIPPHEGEGPGKLEDKWLNDVLEIRQGNNKKFYIQTKVPFKVEKGMTIQLKKVVDGLNEAHEKGFITKEKLTELLESIKMKDESGTPMDGTAWLHYKGTIPPKKKQE